MIRHRPKIRRGVDHVGVVFRHECPCGSTGEWHQTRSLARRDLDNHITTLPLVPVEQQCRMPRVHGCREWEPCETCERQLPLFDLEMTA